MDLNSLMESDRRMKNLTKVLAVIAVVMGCVWAWQNFSGNNFFGTNTVIQGKNFSYDSETNTVYLQSGWIESVDYAGRDVILKSSVGDNIVIPNGYGKILTVIDVNGVKSTYKAEFGIRTLDDHTYSADGTELILGSSFNRSVNVESKASYEANVINVNASMVKTSVKLSGDGADNIIIAAKGGGEINGGKGWNDKDALYGSSGSDVFVWGGAYLGNDTIYNYTKGQDSIKLLTGRVGSYKIDGNDVILKCQTTTLTVKNIKPEDIDILQVIQRKNTADKSWMDKKDLANNITYEQDAVHILKNFKYDFYLDNYKDAPKDIDASKTNHIFYIEGDERDNVIISGQYMVGINGLAGDDSIYCGIGVDEIYWGADKGNDTIYNFTKNDCICLLSQDDDINGYRIDGNDIIFISGESKLTIKNGISVGIKNIKVLRLGGYQYDSWHEKQIFEQ